MYSWCTVWYLIFCLLTFSAVVVHIWAAFDSGAINKLCSKAITSAAMLFATWPLMNGLTGSVLYTKERKIFKTIEGKNIQLPATIYRTKKGSLWTSKLFLRVLQIPEYIKKSRMYSKYRIKVTYLASSEFLSLQIDVCAVFFLSPVDIPLVVSGLTASMGGPTLTIRPDCAHLVALRRAAVASSVITSQQPLWK